VPCASGSLVTRQIAAIPERNATRSAITQYTTHASSRCRGRQRRRERATIPMPGGADDLRSWWAPGERAVKSGMCKVLDNHFSSI
jgi:hypothetical protein